ncbi:MAG TPA: hypothetical protein VK550_14520 [Polyangiaceae bacterium]|nr:hypothetical protein [Polyangiaceae bacterium]
MRKKILFVSERVTLAQLVRLVSLARSLERYLPDVRRHIVTKRWFTPRDFQSELASYQGSAFSVAPTLMQSAWFDHIIAMKRYRGSTSSARVRIPEREFRAW